MNVFVVLSLNPFFENSASANRCLTLTEGLSKLGVEIHFLITGGYSSFAEYKLLGRKGTFRSINYQYLTFTFNQNIWFRRINVYLLKAVLAHWSSIRIKIIVRQKPEAILWTGSDLNSFILVSEIKKSNPNIITFLELSEFMDIHNYNKGNALQRHNADKRQSFFEQEAFYAYDGLALMTKTLLQQYQNFPKPGPRLLHLPMTVDLERFSKTLPATQSYEQPYIAFIGVMNNLKDGVDILIEAFSKIATEFPAVNLYLFGFWHYDSPGHQQQIKSLNLKNRVFYKGTVTREEIPTIIMNAKLLVLPRPDSKQAQGGYPTKLGEYLATGNPVCATTVGEIPDYLVDGESVFFAKPGSVDSFAEAMKRALNNSEEAKRIGANGKKVAEKYFNKDIQAKLLYDFLSETLTSDKNSVTG